MKEIYGCLSLKETLQVEVLGYPQKLTLKWANNQIGALPVFNSREDALNYVDGDEKRVFSLKIVKD